jgi:hypothetical protein
MGQRSKINKMPKEKVPKVGTKTLKNALLFAGNTQSSGSLSTVGLLVTSSSDEVLAS